MVIFSSLFFLYCIMTPRVRSEAVLDDILLSDIIGEVLLEHTSNDKCNPTTASGAFSFSFDFEEPYFDPMLTSNERVLFLAEIKHDDPNPDMSWAIRIGQAGNVYSYRGPLGETMPVNRMPGNYMVDEVWQSVAVDSYINDIGNNHPNGKYFIHQAGVYQKDTPYTDAPYFFSPSIAKHCDQSKRQCLFASWGQHAHVPTKFISKAINVNRYRDCGNGVLEFTSVVVNADNHKAADLDDYMIDHTLPTKFNYMSFPWFGVRDTVYRDVLIKNNKITAEDQNWLTQFPPPIFNNHISKQMPDTGGFTVFAQYLNSNHRGEFTFPGFWSDPTAAPDFVIGALAGQTVPCEPWRSHSYKYQAYHVRCKLNTEISYNVRCAGCELTFTNKNTGASIDIANIVHWSWLTDVGLHEGDRHIYFGPKVGVNGKRWAWAEYDEGFAQTVANEVNNVLTVGSEILISWTDSGLSDDENYCLALVHGTDQEISTFLNGFRGDVTQYWGSYGKMQWGSAFSYERQYMVLNEVQNIDISPGVTFGRNQYIITNKGVNAIDAQAQQWVNASIQDYNNIGDLPGTPMVLFKSNDGTKFGVTLRDHTCDGVAICTGYSTPQHEPIKGFTLPHFQIKCGNQTYFGPDINYFSHFDANGIIRTYICDPTNISVRPTVKLIGYFAEGACAALETSVYDSNYCELEGPPTSEGTSSPTASPVQNSSPTVAPVQQTPSPTKAPVPTLPPTTLAPTTAPIAMPNTWSTLRTKFDGYLRTFGAMFDIQAINNITILGFDINSVPKTDIGIEIYTREGVHTGHEASPDGWYMICKTTMQTVGKRKPSMIPMEEIVPVNLVAGQTQSFYITLLLPLMKVSRTRNDGDVGDVLESNDDLKVLVGNSVFYYFSRNMRHRSWNGNIHYSHGHTSMNWKDLAQPALGKRFNLKWFKREKKQHPVFYTEDKRPKSPWKNDNGNKGGNSVHNA